MSGVVIGAVSLVSGLLGALGMGAGTVLLLYLRLWGGVEQLAAQGINLVFFLPVAVLSLCFHARSGLVDWKTAGLCVLAGLPTVFGGVWLASALDTRLLSKLLALLLLAIGLRELFFAQRRKPPDGGA